MEPLRPQDVFFWHVETASVPEHVGGLVILDASTAPDGAVTLDDLVRLVECRSPRLPGLSSRVLTPPFGLARPAWAVDRSLDVRRHVRGATIARGEASLHRAVAETMARPLDRGAPMWEMTLFEGSQPPTLAWMIKLHHAIADGVGAIDIGCTFCDPEPVAAPTRAPAAGAPPARPPRRDPSEPSLFVATLGLQLRAMAGSAGRAAAAFRREPRVAIWHARRAASGVAQLARDGRAPRSPLNGPVTGAREFATASVAMEDVVSIKRAFRCGLNDIVLAAVGEGLARWFGRRGIEPPPALRAVSPTSVRGASDGSGNWTVGISVPVPLGPLEPAARLHAVREAGRRIRRSDRPAGARFVMQALGTWLPAGLHAAAARRMYHGGWFNIVVTTMTGARAPLYLAGARVVTAYPVLPLAPGVGLTVGAMTWIDRLSLGFSADPNLVPALERLVKDVEDAIAALVDGARSASSGLPSDNGEAMSGAKDSIATPGRPVAVGHERVQPDRPEAALG